ncbi:MAG: aldehyde ferredoxin oxidoreductase C-terminal domain-containing protein, partial [Chloroflexota bacterium]|nr:aldehyde ferredoxin oxidoreductase C-terminal domain-containing protein [Chloroflexota bacterium]
HGADPLGPDNILGLMPGLLTGTPLFGIRYQAVAKTPKNGGWGDANCGGDFGPFLKHAGWDGLLFSGLSDRPVYLLIEDDRAQIRDASDLWGLDAITTEEKLKERHGKKASIACIGPAGENLSYMAGICNERGRLAGRSGLGAVMGSKKLKAVVALASRNILAGDDKGIRALVRTSIDEFGPIATFFRTFGTTGITSTSAFTGDSPVKNWGGAGSVDFPAFPQLTGDKFNAKMDRTYACWHCPLACGAESNESDNPQYPYPKHTHRAEYETACSFGTLTLTADIDCLQYANHLCNAYGLDSISAGATVAFAIECYENGLITKEDTDGLDLTWGNSGAIIEMLHRIGKREGIGDLFADGIRKAADKLGPKAEPFAMEIGGEELPMHDAKLQPEYFTTYKLDPTPSRHTLYEGGARGGWAMPPSVQDRNQATGRGEHHKGAAEYMHVVNSIGTCMFIMFSGPNERIPEWINAVTDWGITHEELRQTGERIANLRMAFQVREGDNPARRRVPGRLVGSPPLAEGPHKDFSLDTETMQREFLAACDWDQQTCKPSRAKLEELGLQDVADALYG